MRKKAISVLLLVTMLMSIVPAAAAEPRDISLEETMAADLKELGLFKGVSETDFALRRSPDRTEALVMLIRLLGREKEALESNWSHPFTDVPAWADKYVSYAYKSYLTNGVDPTHFGSDEAATSSMYLTFVLRALGYSDDNGMDFTWDAPYELARKVNILSAHTVLDDFWRADVVAISYAALSAKLKNSNQSLAEKLTDAGVFTREKYLSVYDYSLLEQTPSTSLPVLTKKEIVKSCSPAVFDLSIYNLNGSFRETISGFFISSDGLAVTSYHNVGTPLHLLVRTADNKLYDDVTIVSCDKWNDIVLLKVGGSGFPYLTLSDSNRAEKGQNVYFFKDYSHLSEGTIADPKVDVDGTDYFSLSMPLRQGASGGPLLDDTGKVIGVVTDGFTVGDQAKDMAIPANYINNLDKTAREPLILWVPYHYPRFEYVFDFGRMTGVTPLAAVVYKDGMYMEYDAFDFYDAFESYDPKAALSDSACRDIALNIYCQGLLVVGFKEVPPHSLASRFERENEAVEIGVDLEAGKIIILTELL